MRGIGPLVLGQAGDLYGLRGIRSPGLRPMRRDRAEMNQIADMLAYADFLVWVSEVERGWVECPAAEELIDGYYLMYPVGSSVDGDRAVATSPALYAHYEDWGSGASWY